MLFLLGLLTGFAIPLATNPRMALSSHLEGVLNGLVLLALGVIWPRLALSRRAAQWAQALLLYGAFANWAFTLLAAAFGTGRSTPIASGDRLAAPWQEGLVDFGLFSLSFAMIAATGIVLFGLRRGTPYHAVCDADSWSAGHGAPGR